MRDDEKRAMSRIEEAAKLYLNDEISLLNLQATLYGVASGIDWSNKKAEGFLEDAATSLEDYVCGLKIESASKDDISNILHETKRGLEKIIGLG